MGFTKQICVFFGMKIEFKEQLEIPGGGIIRPFGEVHLQFFTSLINRLLKQTKLSLLFRGFLD